MRRFLVALVPLLASVAVSPVLLEPHRAFACTIDATYDPLRGADGSWSTNRMVTRFSDESARPVPGEALSQMLGGRPADGSIESAAPLQPDTGAGTEPAAPSAREIIFLAAASSIFLGVVLLAAIAAMAQPETPTRRR